MFGTNFGKGGYNNYASQQNRVDTANAQQQKSARISDATKGKKKQRKPENKGKHRRVVKTKEQNVSLKDKNVGDVGLSVQFIRQSGARKTGIKTTSSRFKCRISRSEKRNRNNRFGSSKRNSKSKT